MRASWPALVLTIAACADGPGNPFASMPDTMAGHRLGTILPEARRLAAEHGDEFECDEPSDSGLVSCGPRGYDFDSDRVRLTFDEGVLAYINWELGKDWESVPFDSLRARLAAYGDPGPRLAADTVLVWSRKLGEIGISLFCMDPGSRCNIALSKADSATGDLISTPGDEGKGQRHRVAP